MKSSIFWDITPRLHTCFHACILLHLFFGPKDGGDVPSKCQETFNGLQGVISRKILFFDFLFICHTFIIMSRFYWVTIEGVWTGNWIHWTVRDRIALALQHALGVLSLRDLHRFSPGNGFQRCRFLSFRAHVLTGRRLSPNHRTENSSIVVSWSCSTDHVDNTASQLVHWCMLGICCPATDVVCRVIT
jgi:hypothetical protein